MKLRTVLCSPFLAYSVFHRPRYISLQLIPKCQSKQRRSVIQTTIVTDIFSIITHRAVTNTENLAFITHSESSDHYMYLQILHKSPSLSIQFNYTSGDPLNITLPPHQNSNDLDLYAANSVFLRTN